MYCQIILGASLLSLSCTQLIFLDFHWFADPKSWTRVPRQLSSRINTSWLWSLEFSSVSYSCISCISIQMDVGSVKSPMGIIFPPLILIHVVLKSLPDFLIFHSLSDRIQHWNIIPHTKHQIWNKLLLLYKIYSWTPMVALLVRFASSIGKRR